MLRLEIRMEYDRRRTAESVYDAVGPDNDGYVESRLDGKSIVFSMESDSAGALRNTADDLMACVKAAEEASGLSGAGDPEEE